MIFTNKNNDSISPFNVGLSLAQINSPPIDTYFKTKLSRFAQDLSLNSVFLEEILFQSIFTDVEFNKPIPDEKDLSFINKYFYPIVFNDIKKADNGRIEFKTKFAFTLDHSLTKQISASGIKYGELTLGKKPVLYYIFVDIQDILEILKEN